MVYRGCVLENKSEYIIVLTKDSQYLKLRKRGDIKVGSKILFLEEDIIRDEKPKYSSYKTLVAAVFIIMIMSITLLQFGLDFFGLQTYAIVSLDINPSLQFELNKKQLVKKVIPLDKEGENIIDDRMVGMAIDEAILLGIENAREKKYLNGENNIILVTDVIKKDSENYDLDYRESIIKGVKENTEINETQIIFIDTDKDSIREAKKNNVSIGKYELYKELAKENAVDDINQLKNKSIGEIIRENKEIIEKHFDDKDKDKEIDKNKGKNERNNNKNKEENRSPMNQKDNKENKNAKNEKDDDKKDDKKDKKDEKENKGIGNSDEGKRGKENQDRAKEEKDKKDKDERDEIKNKDNTKDYNNDKDDKDNEDNEDNEDNINNDNPNKGRDNRNKENKGNVKDKENRDNQVKDKNNNPSKGRDTRDKFMNYFKNNRINLFI